MLLLLVLTQCWSRSQLLWETILFPKPVKPMNNFQLSSSWGENQSQLMQKDSSERIQVGLPILSDIWPWSTESSQAAMPVHPASELTSGQQYDQPLCQTGSLLPDNSVNIRNTYLIFNNTLDKVILHLKFLKGPFQNTASLCSNSCTDHLLAQHSFTQLSISSV